MTDQANAEVIGSLLVIAVLATAIIAAAPSLRASVSPPGVPELRIVADASPGSTTVALTRTGGAAVDLSLMRVLVVAGDEILFDAPAGSPDAPWLLGQTVAVGPTARPLETGDKAEVSLVFMDGSMGHLIATEPVMLALEPGPGSAGGLTIAALGTSYAPTSILPTQNFLAIGEVDHTGGRKLVYSVVAEVPSLVAPVSLTDGGTGGDENAGDGRYSAYFTIPVNALPGVYPVLITATDIMGNRLTNVTFVAVTTPALPTGDIPMDPTPPPASSPPPDATSSPQAFPPPDSTPPPAAVGSASSPPATTACFTILPNGGVASLLDQSVRTIVIGTQITYGATGPPIPVRVSYTTNGGSSLTPMNNGNPISAGQTVQFASLAGDVVGARGRADYLNLFNHAYNSYTADPHVKVLKNGTAAPNVPAFGSQTSIETFLQPYVVDGKMKLTETQVIVLYEFNPSLTSSAADFQDLVILFQYPEGCRSS